MLPEIKRGFGHFALRVLDACEAIALGVNPRFKQKLEKQPELVHTRKLRGVELHKSARIPLHYNVIKFVLEAPHPERITLQAIEKRFGADRDYFFLGTRITENLSDGWRVKLEERGALENFERMRRLIALFDPLMVSKIMALDPKVADKYDCSDGGLKEFLSSKPILHPTLDRQLMLSAVRQKLQGK